MKKAEKETIVREVNIAWCEWKKAQIAALIESREECERKARHYPARDDTEYAGNFTDEHAFEKLCESVGQDY